MFATADEMESKLRHLQEQYEALNLAALDARNRCRYLTCENELAAAEAEEKRLLGEINRLMDRLRAAEAHLVSLRKGQKPRFQ